ncbi:hypothetical protein pipiens_015720 [Culex pipiens pipiens]|uniref:Uncharacterized protein n=1 Tax=Culex pipiens pipiens TaxID=38569 RepID=A0ABD1CPB2_CULPP
MSEFKVRVHTLKFAFGQGSQEPSDAEMFGFCRDSQMPPNEIYSIHRDTQAKAIFVKFKSERQMKAVKDKLQPLTPPPSSPALAQPSLPITPAQPSLPISPAQPSLPISPPVPMGPPQAPVLPEGSARKPRNKFRRGTEGKGEAIPKVPAGGSVTLVQKLRSRSRSERRPHDNAGQDQAGKGRSASRSDQQEVTAESDADFVEVLPSAKSTQYQKLNELAVDLGNGLDVRAEIAIVKSRLMEMECQRLQYLGNKLSGTSLIENEKMNIFHVSNQVHRFSASSSFKLLDDGALTDYQDRLKAIIQGFYSNCFMNDPLQADEGVVAEALGSVSKTLSVEQANQMLRQISEDELKSTSLAAAKKKSPGPDGLSYEFYLTHFDIVKEDLL